MRDQGKGRDLSAAPCDAHVRMEKGRDQGRGRDLTCLQRCMMRVSKLRYVSLTDCIVTHNSLFVKKI